MGSDVKSSDGFHLQGFVDIEIINKKDRVKRRYHNTITNAGKQFLLSKCAQQLFSMTACVHGDLYASGALTVKGTGNGQGYTSTSSNTITGRSGDAGKDITNVLLRLGNEIQPNSSTTLLNVWNSDASEADKVIGYANENVSPAPNGKEGAIDYNKAEYMTDPFAVVKRWRYSEKVASGTIDTIAMMPAADILTPYGDGIRVMKCLDMANSQEGTFNNFAINYLPPGIPGITGNSEIILNYDCNSGTKWKYDFVTGETTIMPSTTFVLPLGGSTSGVQDYFVEGNYLYVLYLQSIGGTVSNLYVEIYDISNPTNVTMQGTRRSQSISGTGNGLINARFLSYENNLYITIMSSTNISVAANFRMCQMVKSGAAYYNSFTNLQSDYSMLGVQLPAGLNVLNVAFGNYGEKYAMFVATQVPLVSPTSGNAPTTTAINYRMKAYIFNELGKIDLNNAVDCIYGLSPNSVLWSAGNNKGVLQVGFAYCGNTDQTFLGQIYDNYDAITMVHNNSGTLVNNMFQKGIMLSLDGWWTDVLSFVRLQTPIQKGDDDIMYVSYGYKIV